MALLIALMVAAEFAWNFANPTDRDFISFWGASQFALNGQPALAYDNGALHALQSGVVSFDDGGEMPFPYPPAFLFLVMPFGLPSFPLGLVLWSLAGYAVYLAVARRLTPKGALLAAASVTFDDQGSSFVVRAEVPGVAEKDIELRATATALTLKGKRQVEAPKGYSTHRSERSSWSFARTFELPAKVDADRVEARLENGVLTVTLPKAPEAQPKQIAVRAG